MQRQPLDHNPRYFCRICGGHSAGVAPYPTRVPLRSAALTFESIAICSACGFGMAEPPVSQHELDAFYASGAYWHASQGSSAQLAHEHNQARHRVSRCLRYAEGRIRVGDVGAGHGAIADWLERLADDRVDQYDFVEPDAASRQFVLGRTARFPITALDGVDALHSGYDLVFLNHVLEHVADPVEFMGVLRDRLRPGGVLYVETPHADYRFKDDVFPHTLFFTPQAIARLVGRVGMDLLECTSFGAYPGREGGLGPTAFRVLGAAFHWAARAGITPLCMLLDDAIWRYGAREDGMWLRVLARRCD